MIGFVDDAAEYRLLAACVDRPESILGYTAELFTGDRARIFQAMQQAYLVYGEISTEGVEKFYGRILPPELEAARGAKPGAVLDKLVELATRRGVSDMINRLGLVLANRDLDRAQLDKILTMKPLIASDDSGLTVGITVFSSDLTRKIMKQYNFVRTGLGFLDHMLGGEWPRKALTVILGQGGGGKTALIVQSILNMARMEIPSLFISLEMPRDRIIARMVANISGIDGMRIRRGEITPDEQLLVNAAMDEIQELDKFIFIVDKPGLNIIDIQHQIRLHKERNNIQAFFVDYLQIIDRPESENPAEALGYLAQQLRNTAVSLDISAVLLSQQNRGFTGLSSILGSGRVGHIADAVFEIELDKSTENDSMRMCSINFHKNRDGPLGVAGCLYYPRILRFE
jgi:KaiC/GvpD/RAD55 family RecA-like ATPase